MKTALLLVGLVAPALAQEQPFTEAFPGKLDAGWSWVREEKSAWRVTKDALEIRVLPGNLWGRANNVKNVLVRPAPEVATGAVEIVVSIENKPTHQYEQANLAWYYDDSHMVKLGLELVDGQVCIVMGREEADRTRTLAKIPVAATSVQVRMTVEGRRIRGEYRASGQEQWLPAGEGETPVPPAGRAQISLHAYQGDPATEHWARFSDLRMRAIPAR